MGGEGSLHASVCSFTLARKSGHHESIMHLDSIHGGAVSEEYVASKWGANETTFQRGPMTLCSLLVDGAPPARSRRSRTLVRARQDGLPCYMSRPSVYPRFTLVPALSQGRSWRSMGKHNRRTMRKLSAIGNNQVKMTLSISSMIPLVDGIIIYSYRALYRVMILRKEVSRISIGGLSVSTHVGR